MHLFFLARTQFKGIIMSLTKVSNSMISGAATNLYDLGLVDGGDLYTSLSTALASTASIIVIPAGTFTLSAPITITRNVRLTGSGSGPNPGATIITYAGNGIALTVGWIGTTQTDNVHLENFTITGTVNGIGGILFGLGTQGGASLRSSMTSVSITGFSSTVINQGYGLFVAECYLSKFTLVNCDNNNVGIIVGGTAGLVTTTSCGFYNCYVRSNKWGIDVHNVVGIQFYSLIAEGCGSSAVNIAPTNVQVLDVDFFGIYTEANCLSVASPVINLDHTGTGTTFNINFYGGGSAEGLSATCTSIIYFGKCANVKFTGTYQAANLPGWIQTGVDTAQTCFVESWEGNDYPDSNVTNNSIDPANGFYRVRLLNFAQVLTTKSTLSMGLAYSISTTGGLNNQGSFLYTDSSLHSTGVNVASGFVMFRIDQDTAGNTMIPFYGNGGSGTQVSGSLFNPSTGAFVYGTSGVSVSFATQGTGAGTFTLSIDAVNGIASIQRTAGTQNYTLSIFRVL